MTRVSVIRMKVLTDRKILQTSRESIFSGFLILTKRGSQRVETMIITPLKTPKRISPQLAPCQIPTRVKRMSESRLTGSVRAMNLPNFFFRNLENFAKPGESAIG